MEIACRLFILLSLVSTPVYGNQADIDKIKNNGKGIKSKVTVDPGKWELSFSCSEPCHMELFEPDGTKISEKFIERGNAKLEFVKGDKSNFVIFVRYLKASGEENFNYQFTKK